MVLVEGPRTTHVIQVNSWTASPVLRQPQLCYSLPIDVLAPGGTKPSADTVTTKKNNCPVKIALAIYDFDWCFLDKKLVLIECCRTLRFHIMHTQTPDQ